MIDLIRKQQDLIQQVQQQSIIELPEAYITVRRTAAQAIVGGGGAIVTWQQVVRSNVFSFTPPAEPIVIPTPGYYLVSFNGLFSVNLAEILVRLQVGGNIIATEQAISGTARNGFNVTFFRYFNQNDNVRMNFLISANANLQVVAEGSGNESPFLNIVQVTRGAI